MGTDSKRSKGDYEKDRYYWVCLNIAERFSNRMYYEKVKDSIVDLFGENQDEILFVGNDLGNGQYENALESYAFVHCKNIYDYKMNIERSKYVNGLLHSFNSICFISEYEISELKKDWESKQKIESTTLFFGDFVKVKSGKYEKLKGIVIDKNKDKYLILFKFCSGYDIFHISESNLEKVNNLFDVVKLPYE